VNALAITVDRATTSRSFLSPDGFLHESLINIAILLNQINETAEEQNQAQAGGWQ
jgi:hypothetical protein